MVYKKRVVTENIIDIRTYSSARFIVFNIYTIITYVDRLRYLFAFQKNNDIFTSMKPTRLEAFSDGVIAIIITIMVLEIKLPHEPTLYALLEQIPIFISYLLSFVWVGIYWNNHHHLFHVATKVTPKIMWSNLNLLFWMSLMPFVTGWLGENHREVAPMLVYVYSYQ